MSYFLLWAVTLATALYLRPLIPVDETRATTVAWEMWVHGDWLVPHVNGEPYSHKPPLLQWTILLGWLLFGVNEWRRGQSPRSSPWPVSTLPHG